MMTRYMKTLALAALTLSSSAMATDALPQFTIAYFNGSCPDGWDSASVASANGRFLIPSMSGGGVGTFAGKALASQQQPTHLHSTATGSITTSSKEYVLIGGCCNDNLGNAGTYTMSGSATSSSAALPYIQYNVCMKGAVADPATTTPSGVTTFYTLPMCPDGWSAVNSAAGRYPVGLPANGAPSATFGGPTLRAGEVRTHSHSMNGTMSLPEHDIAGASGCCASGYAGSGNTGFSGNTVPNADDLNDSAAQAPYWTATFCKKN